MKQIVTLILTNTINVYSIWRSQVHWKITQLGTFGERNRFFNSDETDFIHILKQTEKITFYKYSISLITLSTDLPAEDQYRIYQFSLNDYSKLE